MDIFELLKQLDIDITNSDARKGVADAISAILASRTSGFPFPGGLPAGAGGMFPSQIEVDPDLLLPSQKSSSSSQSDIDIEFQDDEKILDKVQRNNSDAAPEQNSDEQGSDSESGSSGNGESGDNGFAGDSPINKPSDGSSGSAQEPQGGSSDNSGSSDDSGASETSGSNTDAGEDDVKPDIVDRVEQEKLNRRKIQHERVMLAAQEAAKHATEAGADKEKIDSLMAAIQEFSEISEEAMSEMSEQEFNVATNKIFNAMDALGVKDITYTTDAERKVRATEIQRELSDATVQSEIFDDDLATIRRDKATQAILDAEKERYQRKDAASFSGFDSFKKSLKRAVARQVVTGEKTVDSWGALNRRRSGTGILRPGEKREKLPGKKIPVIDFYFDCSGSWGQSDIDTGKKAVQELVDLDAAGKIKINIWYFANRVAATPDYGALGGAGTNAWNHIIRNIRATGATNVVIMTDGDMQNRGGDNGTFLTHTVSGYVWYLWKNGINAPRLPQDLKGKAGTSEFSFTST